jgi:photosystem II PsbY protein
VRSSAGQRRDCCEIDQGVVRRDPLPGSVPKIGRTFHRAAMDLRLLLVLFPIALAAAWAVFHIGRAAVGQLQLFIKRARV